ncbi:MAG TPA: hypothetical protein VGI10_05855 [Polyangiaceae bacterium]|jgi:hypothetical protein
MGASVLGGCVGSLSSQADWPPLAKKWFDRGDASFRRGDLEDAEIAVENALRAGPNREEVKLLASRVALAELNYARSVQVLKGVDSQDARSLRGRAYWYAGDVDHAADELERLVADPEVHDPWASEIAKLARRGSGRKPFELSGGMLATTDMPRAGTASLIVPLEINGEPALGLVATGTAEAVVDAANGSESSWVSLRFGERVEVHDVPALAKDLSGISRQVNAPIKILLGVNLLRHLHPTFDFGGGQFVVRRYEPPPPPQATTVKLSYARGGGMMMRGAFGSEQTAPQCSLLIDTSILYPVALDEAAWKKAGVSLASLRGVPNGGALKQGILPILKLGAFDVPNIPGLSGDAPIKEREEGLGVDLDGLVGSGLLANFRVTLADGGRTMWLEDAPPQEPVGPELSAPVDDSSDLPDDSDDDDAPPKAGKGKAPAKAPAPKPVAKPAGKK